MGNTMREEGGEKSLSNLKRRAILNIRALVSLQRLREKRPNTKSEVVKEHVESKSAQKHTQTHTF